MSSNADLASLADDGLAAAVTTPIIANEPTDLAAFRRGLAPISCEIMKLVSKDKRAVSLPLIKEFDSKRKQYLNDSETVSDEEHNVARAAYKKVRTLVGVFCRKRYEYASLSLVSEPNKSGKRKAHLQFLLRTALPLTRRFWGEVRRSQIDPEHRPHQLLSAVVNAHVRSRCELQVHMLHGTWLFCKCLHAESSFCPMI